jgi:hypothetical protein
VEAAGISLQALLAKGDSMSEQDLLLWNSTARVPRKISALFISVAGHLILEAVRALEAQSPDIPQASRLFRGLLLLPGLFYSRYEIRDGELTTIPVRAANRREQALTRGILGPPNPPVPPAQSAIEGHVQAVEQQPQFSSAQTRERVTKQVGKGQLSKGMRTLTAIPTAAGQSREEIFNLATELFPASEGDRPARPLDAPAAPFIEDDKLDAALALANTREPAVGVDGWSAPMWFAVASAHLGPLCALCNHIALGRLDERAIAWFTAGRLVALPKRVHGKMEVAKDIRPIVIGNVLYTLIAKLLTKKLPKVHQLFQFGTSVNGTSDVLSIVRTAMEARGDQAWTLVVDVVNAFNALDRNTWLEAMYEDETCSLAWRFIEMAYGGDPSVTMLDDEGVPLTLLITQGLRQGCPLAMYVFCKLFQSVISAIRSAAPGAEPAAYAEDCTVVCSSLLELQYAHTAIVEAAALIGLEVHPGKSFIHVDAATFQAEPPPAAPLSLTVSHSPFLLLGHMVGGTRSARIEASSAQILESFQTFASQLANSGLSPQVQFLLLLFCLNAKLVHHLRNSPYSELKEARLPPPVGATTGARLLDHLDEEMIELIHRIAPDTDLDQLLMPIRRMLINQPVRWAGTGITSLVDRHAIQFLAATAKSASTLAGRSLAPTAPAALGADFATYDNYEMARVDAAAQLSTTPDGLQADHPSSLPAPVDIWGADAADPPSVNAHAHLDTLYKNRYDFLTQTTQTQDAIVPSHMPAGANPKHWMISLRYNRERGASEWLLAFPADQSLTLKDTAFSLAMQLRLAMSSPHVPTQCNCYTARTSARIAACEVDSRHFLSCNLFKKTTNRRHNKIRDLIDAVAECSAPEMGPLLYEGDIARSPRLDVVVFGHDRTKWIDVRCTDLARIGQIDAEMKQASIPNSRRYPAIQDAERAKRAKYSRFLDPSLDEMVPFIVTSAGSLSKTADALIASLINVSPQRQRILRQAICIAVHNGNADMLQQWLATKRLRSITGLNRIQAAVEAAGQ